MEGRVGSVTLCYEKGVLVLEGYWSCSSVPGGDALTGAYRGLWRAVGDGGRTSRT